MLLVDVNLLVYAHRRDAAGHARARAWLQQLLDGSEAFGVSDLVLSGFIRIVTNPRIFSPPSTVDEALAFADAIRGRSNCVLLAPGPRHWSIFSDLCRRGDARGNLAADAYLAALAIETGSEWVTTDRDFSRFPGLRWRNPFEPRRR